MSRRHRVAGALVVVLLAGCAELPQMPPPVPTDVVPTIQPTPTISAGDTRLSPDGFDAVRRMAVRIRNVVAATAPSGR